MLYGQCGVSLNSTISFHQLSIEPSPPPPTTLTTPPSFSLWGGRVFCTTLIRSFTRHSASLLVVAFKPSTIVFLSRPIIMYIHNLNIHCTCYTSLYTPLPIQPIQYTIVVVVCSFFTTPYNTDLRITYNMIGVIGYFSKILITRRIHIIFIIYVDPTRRSCLFFVITTSNLQ